MNLEMYSLASSERIVASPVSILYRFVERESRILVLWTIFRATYFKAVEWPLAKAILASETLSIEITESIISCIRGC